MPKGHLYIRQRGLNTPRRKAGLYLIICLGLVFSVLPTLSWAQIGGKSSMGFLNSPVGALASAMGGQNASIISDDPTLQLSNPALLNDKMHGRLGMSYTPWFAYNNFGSSYAHHLEESGTTLGGTIVFNNYGKFVGLDAGGNPSTDFTASDFALVVGAAQAKGNFRLGGNFKFASSSIGGYSAQAIAVDFGAAFVHPKKELRIGLVVKNLGFGLTNYTDQSPTLRLPLDVQAGLTYKLAHMPLRFSITTHSLNVWDVTYQNPNPLASNDPRTRTNEENNKPFFDQIARRVVIGGEFLLGKGFNIRAGYNHLINRELKQEQAGGASGFSFGGMMRIKSFEIAYTQAIYHAQGSTGVLTIGIDMARIGITKKQASATENLPISN